METAFPCGNAAEYALFVFVNNVKFVTLYPVAVFVGMVRASFYIARRTVKVGSGFVVGRRDDQIVIIEA